MFVDRIRQLLLFVVGVSLPTEDLNVNVGGLALTPNKVVNLPLLLLAALLWANRGSKGRASSGKDVFVVFFALSVGVSAVGGFLQQVDVHSLAMNFLTWVALLIFYFVLTFVITSRSDVDTLVRGMATGIIIVVASALMGFGVQADTIYGERMSGIGGNANMFAFNLVMTFPLVLALMLSVGEKARTRVFYAGVILIAVSGILVSLSRSAYLSMALMLTFWMIRFRRPQYAIPMLLAIVLFVVVAPESFYARLSTMTVHGPTDASAEKRIQMLGPIFDAFASSPLVGIGLMRFVPFTYERGYDVHGVIHNGYLQVGAEQGLLGLIPFVAITLLAWRDYGRSWRLAQRMRAYRDQELQALAFRALLFQMAMVGVLVMSQFQPTMRHKGLWILFATSAVMLKLVRQRARELTAQTVPSTPDAAVPLGSRGTLPLRA